jgi:hypothetical protein
MDPDNLPVYAGCCSLLALKHTTGQDTKTEDMAGLVHHLVVLLKIDRKTLLKNEMDVLVQLGSDIQLSFSDVLPYFLQVRAYNVCKFPEYMTSLHVSHPTGFLFFAWYIPYCRRISSVSY